MTRLTRLVPVAFCLLGLVMAHHPMLASGLERIQTDPIDPRLINYLLEHSYRWAMRQPLHRSYWDPPFFYPARNVAAYSDTLLSVAPLYWALRAIGLQPDTTLQIWMISLSAFNYLAAYWLLRRGFPITVLPAAAGAFLFAFAAHRVNELGHPQLLPHVFTVIVLMALVRLFRDQVPARPGALWVSVAALSVVAQLYASFYHGWFLVLGMGLGLAVALTEDAMRRPLVACVRTHWVALFAAAIAACLLLWPLATHYLEAGRAVGPRSFYEVSLSIPEPRSWIYCGPDSWLYGWMPALPFFHGLTLEAAQRLGIGLVTPLVVLAGLASGWRRTDVRLLTYVGLVLAIVTTSIPRPALEAAGLASLVLCTGKLCGSLASARARLGLAAAALALALALFSARALAITAAWVALAAASAWLLGYRRRLAAISLLGLVLFLILATYAELSTVAGAGALVALFTVAELRGRLRVSPWACVVLALLFAALLVIYPEHLMVWRHVYRFVPGARAIRAVARAELLLLIPAAAGFAFSLQRLLEERRRVLAGVLLVVSVFEQGVTTPSYDKSARRALVAGIAARVPRGCEAFLYSPRNTGVYYPEYQLDAMWAALERHVPTVNGYSGNYPPGWMPLGESAIASKASEAGVAAARDRWIRRWGLAPDRICWVKDPPQSDTSPLH